MFNVSNTNNSGCWYFGNDCDNLIKNLEDCIPEIDNQFKNDPSHQIKLELSNFVNYFFKIVLSGIPCEINFEEIFNEILKNAPLEFFHHMFSTLKVSDEVYLNSLVYTQIIDKTKQVGYNLILQRQNQMLEKFIQNLKEIIKTIEKKNLKHNLEDAITELTTWLEFAKNLSIESSQNSQLEEAQKKTYNKAKSVLENVKNGKCIHHGNSKVYVISDEQDVNEKDKKIIRIVKKEYNKANSCKEIETVQSICRHFDGKALPPAVCLPERIALISQGYSLNDKNRALVKILKQKACVLDNQIRSDEFIVPKKPLPEEIFSAQWKYTNSAGKADSCSFKKIQELYLLGKINFKHIRINSREQKTALLNALNVGWQIAQPNNVLIQRFVKMKSLSSYPQKLKDWIYSHLSKDVPLQIIELVKKGLFDLHATNIGIKVIKNDNYKEHNKKKYNYIKSEEKTQKLESYNIKVYKSIRDGNLETLIEDYAMGGINENYPIKVDEVERPLKEWTALLETIKTVSYRCVFFDLDNAFPDTNLAHSYTLVGKKHYKLPYRVEFEGLDHPLSDEDLAKLKNSLHDDIRDFTWLLENRLAPEWDEKINAFSERLFSITEMLMLRETLELETNNLEILLSRLERFILSPRSPFSTRKRLKHLAHWYTLQQNQASFQEIQQWRDKLLKKIEPSSLRMFAAMYPLFADTMELTKTVYPLNVNFYMGHYQYPIDNLIKESNELLKDNVVNQLRNAYIERLLSGSKACLGIFFN